MVGRVENVFPYFFEWMQLLFHQGCCNVLIEALCLNKPIIYTPALGLAKELKMPKVYLCLVRLIVSHYHSR